VQGCNDIGRQGARGLYSIGGGAQKFGYRMGTRNSIGWSAG
jgi:hypothetical protein